MIAFFVLIYIFRHSFKQKQASFHSQDKFMDGRLLITNKKWLCILTTIGIFVLNVDLPRVSLRQRFTPQRKVTTTIVPWYFFISMQDGGKQQIKAV